MHLTAKPPAMTETGGFALAPQTMPNIFGEWQHRWGCRTGVDERIVRSNHSIITPVHHRTLILVKVPYSITAVS